MTNGLRRVVCWVIFCAFWFAANSHADVRVEPGLSPDSETTALAQAIRSELATRASPGTAGTVTRVTVGLAAFREALNATDASPIVATYITSTDFYAVLGNRKRPPSITAIFSNPDPVDQVSLAEILLGKSSLGVFDSPAAHDLALRVKTRSVQSIPTRSEQNIDALLQSASSVNGIIVLPDAGVINRTNIGHVVRALYERRAVLIGYSQTLTRAGSLASTYISTEAMSAQIVAVVSDIENGATVPEPIFIRDVSVAINEQLARSLNIAVPPTVELMNSLRARRKESSR